MARIRQQNVLAAQWSPNGSALGAPDLTSPDNEIFGENVFSPMVQRLRLPQDVYQRLSKTLANGEPLDTSLADAVAAAMKEWALERGATHYTHMFQPLTGLTAEKHDSFYEPTGEGTALAEFSGKELIQAEPDASSIPDRGHPRHLRGTWLHRLGPDEPGLHHGEPERRAALHPDRVRVVDRRGARSQDPAAAIDGRPVKIGGASAETARQHRNATACSPRSAPNRSTS